MMSSEKVKPHHVSRIAYVYIRQSTAYQVENNLESQSRRNRSAPRLYLSTGGSI